MSIHPDISGDTTMSRTLPVLVVGAALALIATGCSGAADKSAAGPPSTAVSAPTATTATAGAPTAPTTAVPEPTATTAATGSTRGATHTAKQACPVSKATLLKAMKEDESTVTLGTPECYAGYVLVQTSAKHPVADDEIATLKYESGAWKYLGGSTADFCEGMPAATIKHFESHFSYGCGG
jgi:hypothetical protein